MHTERIYKKPNMIANTSAFKRVAAAAAWWLEVPLQQLLFIASKRQPHTKALIWAEQHVCLGLYDRKLRGKRLASLNLIRQFIRASSVGTYAHCYSYIETLTYFKWYGERMRNSSGKRRYSGTALIKLFIDELKSKLRFSWQLPGEKKYKLTKITATHSTVPGEGTGQYNKADWTITSSNRRAKTLVNEKIYGAGRCPWLLAWWNTCQSSCTHGKPRQANSTMRFAMQLAHRFWCAFAHIVLWKRDNMKRCMKAMPILPRGFSAYDQRMRDFIGIPENDSSWMETSRGQNMDNHIIAWVLYRGETPVE